MSLLHASWNVSIDSSKSDRLAVRYAPFLVFRMVRCIMKIQMGVRWFTVEACMYFTLVVFGNAEVQERHCCAVYIMCESQCRMTIV